VIKNVDDTCGLHYWSRHNEICMICVFYLNITLFDSILASCIGRFPSLLGSPNCFSSFPWAISQSICLWTCSGAWWFEVLKIFRWRCLEICRHKALKYIIISNEEMTFGSKKENVKWIMIYLLWSYFSVSPKCQLNILNLNLHWKY
jgi:hypothetical protein